jgi:hypothetical protein
MKARLLLPLSDSLRCDVAPSSIAIWLNTANASQFTTTTFQSGYSAAVRVNGLSTDGWGFVKASLVASRSFADPTPGHEARARLAGLRVEGLDCTCIVWSRCGHRVLGR